MAGRRAGLAGSRSGLFHEFMRIVADFSPRYVVIENVPGLLSSNEGRDMATVVGTLADIGYGWAYRILDAQYFGLAQRRKRVFIVGCIGADYRRAAKVLFESESLPWDSPPSRETGQGVAACLTRGTGVDGNAPGRRREDDVNLVCDDVSKAVTFHGNQSLNDSHQSLNDSHQSLNDSHQSFVVNIDAFQCQGTNVGPMGSLRRGNGNKNVRRLTPKETERLQGFYDDWTKYRDDGTEVSDSKRYQMCGNAVAVPVLKWIGKRIVKGDQ